MPAVLDDKRDTTGRRIRGPLLCPMPAERVILSPVVIYKYNYEITKKGCVKMKNTAKRIAAILTFLFIFMLLSGCQKADIKEVIIGKWYCVNDSSMLEAFADGNMTVTHWHGEIDSAKFEQGGSKLFGGVAIIPDNFL